MRTCLFAFLLLWNLTSVDLPVQAAPGVSPYRDTLERLESTHFSITYNTQRLSLDKALEAERIAEAGWSHCAQLFDSSTIENAISFPAHKIQLDLTPSFLGATGMTHAARFNHPIGALRSPSGRSFPRAYTTPLRYLPATIAVRYTELDYLGLRPDYVLTHEIGHVCSSSLYLAANREGLSDTSLGEGIADWAAGSFAGIPLHPWWEKALRDAGLWVDPEALFITGNFDERPDTDPRDLTAHYTESALFVQFLVERFGWSKFQAFSLDYAMQRGSLDSNERRKRTAARYHYPWRFKSADRRLPPDAAAVEATFLKDLGETWPQILAAWNAQMDADPAPPQQAEKLVLARKIYAAIRGYESWLMQAPHAPSATDKASIRAAFVRANRALEQVDTAGAARSLQEAQDLIKPLQGK